MKCSKFGILLILLVCFTVSASHAVDIDNATVEIADSNVISSVGNLNDKLMEEPDAPDSNEQPDVPDLIEDENNIVTPDNIKAYFKYGVLNSKYKGQTLTFKGNFTDLGQLTVKSNDVVIQGKDAIFKNTVFSVEGNGVLLKNLTFDLNKAVKDNDGAAIRVNGYDVTLSDLNINYVVPSDVEAYAIYSNGYTGYSSDSLKIINSNINFEGHNDNVFKYNCAIKLTYANQAVIENNTIVSSLPLKKVRYGTEGATLDSDYVYAVGIEECHDFIFRNNTVITDVNKRTAVEYPTLNSIMISSCDNGLFADNSIYVTDFVTYPGVENYIYGVDLHRPNDLLVINNKISIVTTGGKLALGTAYPIQLSGPARGINITLNDLYSFSNGPNIGIYSVNYYGDTDVSITHNKINVTGLAGTHEWALVTGIESQDSNSEIKDNIIEVHSIDTVAIGDNLYAISYRQSTAGTHTFDIQGNTAFTDGYYAVYLLSSDDSTIINNTLISFNENAQTGSNSYNEGPREHNGDEHSNNNVINARDYFGHNNPIIIIRPVNSNLDIDGGIISWHNPGNSPINVNPLIPSYINPSQQNHNTDDNQGSSSEEYHDDGAAQGLIDGSSNSNDNQNSYNGNAIGINVVESDVDSKNSDNLRSSVDSKNINFVDIKGVSSNGVVNTSESTPAIGSSASPLSKSQSSGESSGASESVSKSYEIKKIIEKEEFVPSVFFVIVVLILLIIGFKHKDRNFDKID